MAELTELQVYKHIQENGYEIDWRDGALMVWIYFFQLEEFQALFGSGPFDEGGIQCHMLSDGSIGLDIIPILSHFGIKPENIHPKPKP